MYIDRQIKSLLESVKLTGNDQWINIKETREKINEYKNSQKEFSVEELVGMVKLTDKEVMSKDQIVKDLRLKLYLNPSSSEEIFKEMESLFKGHHVMINVRKNQNGKFIIERVSGLSK
jgi:hypothetical protein